MSLCGLRFQLNAECTHIVFPNQTILAESECSTQTQHSSSASNHQLTDFLNLHPGSVFQHASLLPWATSGAVWLIPFVRQLSIQASPLKAKVSDSHQGQMVDRCLVSAPDNIPSQTCHVKVVYLPKQMVISTNYLQYVSSPRKTIHDSLIQYIHESGIEILLPDVVSHTRVSPLIQ